MVEGEDRQCGRRYAAKIGELNLFPQDKSGRDIYRWSAAAPVTHLNGGQSATFKAGWLPRSVRLTTFWCGSRRVDDMRLSEHG